MRKVPAKRQMKTCFRCWPEGNGMADAMHTQAVGRYYIPPGTPDSDEGWIPACQECLDSVGRFSSFRVEYFQGKEPKQEEEPKAPTGPYLHKFEKDNLTTLADTYGRGYDVMRCVKCGFTWRRWDDRPHAPPKEGCTKEN